ncbi:hypothetical protein [Streptomyces sp. NPDC056544]|uniref:hypothetical protein n=1 Tax=unclassified Streptomyces TaxID=2593676 RepID=UPI0036779464
MTDQVQQQEDDQNLWRAVYTPERGWFPRVAFADHLSIAAPALAEVDGTLYCAHRGARQGQKKQLPLRWTSFTPASVQPFVAALEKVRRPLPEDAADAQRQKWQSDVTAATEALAQARKWAPDRHADGIASSETPALVNDNGTLRMVFTRLGSADGAGRRSSLWETHLDDAGGKPTWAPPKRILFAGSCPLAPGLAVFNGAVHLAYVDPGRASVQHLVRDAEGRWAPVTDTDGKPITLPSRGETVDPHADRKGLDKYGWPGNVALAVHDGELHMVLRASPAVFDFDGKEEQGGEVLHAIFDGNSWNDEHEFLLPDGDPMGSRRSAALASYDGKLHALMPDAESDTLEHTTWTREGGWTEPVKVDGHDSNNTPALLTYKEGPAGAEREALLLVHRGVDRCMPPAPPAPPAPPTLADVASQGKTIHGKGFADYGSQAWSRVNHHVFLTPATMKDGKQALIGSWQAYAQYYCGFSWYRENYGGNYVPYLDIGTLWLRKEGDDLFLQSADFAGSFDDKGRFRYDHVFTDLKPGTYKLTISGANTKKSGGYWWASKAALTTDEPDQQRYTRVDIGPAHATIKI